MKEYMNEQWEQAPNVYHIFFISEYEYITYTKY